MLKEIQIRRKEIKSYLPPTVADNARRKLGSIFVSRAPLRGLEREDELKYLPTVLGVAANSQDFERAARHYWADFAIDVPSDGTILNISVDETTGEPLVIDDWIKYQWAIKHKFVAKNATAARADMTKQFYIYDPEVEVSKNNSELQDKKLAYKELIRISSEKDSMARVLRVLGTTTPEKLNSEQQENLLATLLENDPKKFIQVARDKHLETRDFIYTLMENEVVRKIGNAYFYMDEEIGADMEEAVVYITNKKNSVRVAEMKAKLKEFATPVNETV